MKNFKVRAYKPEDRAAIRKICCDTGFLGKPIDPVFQDRELFTDYLTRYYTDKEPETSMVLHQDGAVMGYILGCRFPQRQKKFDRWLIPQLVVRGLWNYIFKYNKASKKFVHWIVTQGRKQIPYTPENMAHFHINLLPSARGLAQTLMLVESFLQILANTGESKVYGQMVVFETRRGEKMFARYGFEVVDKVEITKYRDVYPTPVYLFTIIKDLKVNPSIYDSSLPHDHSCCHECKHH